MGDGADGFRDQEARRHYKLAEWQSLFEKLDEYIIAVTTNVQSTDVSTAVRLTELRVDFINSLIDREFDLS